LAPVTCFLPSSSTYLRTKSAVNATQFTLSKEKKAEDKPMSAEEFKAMVEASKNAGPDDCLMCGS